MFVLPSQFKYEILHIFNKNINFSIKKKIINTRINIKFNEAIEFASNFGKKNLIF